jgi:hypothetical protein
MHHVDADVLVDDQRPRRAQQEHGAEQNPLKFEPGIRRHVERLADDGINSRDGDRDHDQPGKPAANARVDRVNGPRNRK